MAPTEDGHATSDTYTVPQQQRPLSDPTMSAPGVTLLRGCKKPCDPPLLSRHWNITRSRSLFLPPRPQFPPVPWPVSSLCSFLWDRAHTQETANACQTRQEATQLLLPSYQASRPTLLPPLLSPPPNYLNIHPEVITDRPTLSLSQHVFGFYAHTGHYCIVSWHQRYV